MAKRFLTSPRVPSAAEAPTGARGDLYFDSAAGVLKVHNGTVWVSLGPGGGGGGLGAADNVTITGLWAFTQRVIAQGGVDLTIPAKLYDDLPSTYPEGTTTFIAGGSWPEYTPSASGVVITHRSGTQVRQTYLAGARHYYRSGSTSPNAWNALYSIATVDSAQTLINKTLGYTVANQGLQTAIANGMLPSAGPTAYPVGLSTASVTLNNGWPANGTVLTLNQEGYSYTTQTFIARDSGTAAMWVRAWHPVNTVWGEWRSSTAVLPFRQAYMSSASQAVAAVTWAGISFITEQSNLLTPGISSWETVIPRDGVYLVDGQVTFSASTSGTRGARFLVNNNDTVSAARLATAQQATQSVSRVMRLVAGDTVQFEVYTSTALSAVKENAGQATFFSIQLLAYL